ncbi:MAG: polysaccharide biosynthesis tyrosine autokinase [Candidatus Riflebacteria bacterium]|nr:polysaccharide biosynthesis tyrosine autokinase [Candidatus Riflebacteria bacterium]
MPSESHSSFELQSHLRDHLGILVRHRRPFVALFLGTVASTLVISYLMTPIYEATIKVMVTEVQTQIDITRQLVPVADKEFFQTQVEILKSRPVAEQVVTRLKLDTRVVPLTVLDRLLAGWLWIRLVLSGGGGTRDASLAAYFRFQDEVTNLARRITVSAVRNSQVVEVTAEDHDQLMAAKIADTVGAVFLERLLELKRDDSRKANQYLTARLSEVEKKLVTSEEALRRFQEEKQAVHLDTKIRNLVEVKTINVDDDLAQVQKSLQEETARFEQLGHQLMDQRKKVASGQQGGAISEMKVVLMQKETELARLLTAYTSAHPDVQKLEQELETVRRRISTEQNLLTSGSALAADKVTESLEEGYNNSQQSLKVLLTRKQTLIRLKDEYRFLLRELLNLKARNAILQRDLDVNQKVYEMLLLKQKEASLKEALTIAGASIVEPATIPKRPIRPRKIVNLALGLVVGLTLGIGLAYFLEYLDTTLKSKAEIARILGAPVLATIHNRALIDGVAGGVEKVSLTLPTSPMAEAFKSLRASIKHAMSAIGGKVLLVTSAYPGDGKTTVATNLAISLAQSGDRVLLVDGDLRNPKVDDLFELKGKPGLGNVVDSEIETMLHPCGQEKLLVLPAGKRLSNPSEFLESPKVKQFIKELRERFDWIVVDSPPVNVVSDPMVLGPQVDGVLLVVFAGREDRSALEAAVERMRSVHATILGGLINNIQTPGSGDQYYYYRYRRYHGYGYGYGYGYGQSHGSRGDERESGEDEGRQQARGE